MSKEDIEDLNIKHNILADEIMGLDNKLDVATIGMNGKLDLLISYLHNDDKTGRKGLIQKVDEVCVEISAINERERVRKQKLIFYTSILSGGFFVIWEFIKKFW